MFRCRLLFKSLEGNDVLRKHFRKACMTTYSQLFRTDKDNCHSTFSKNVGLRQCLIYKERLSVLRRYSATLPSDVESDDSERLLYVGPDGIRLKRMLGSFYFFGSVVGSFSLYHFCFSELSTAATILMGINVSCFVILNPIGLYQFGKRYVSKLYHNHKTDTYTVHLLSPLLLQDKKLSYSPQECKMPPHPTMFTSYFVNGHPLFVNSDEMDYSAYSKMLRFAQDLDYENPERQQEYKKTISQAIKKKQSQTDNSESN